MNLVLEFLTELYQSGLGYSAINTARSAISSVLTVNEAKSIGSHPTICRFLKGVFELRTPLPRYSGLWDVNVLLKYFESLPENFRLNLKLLSQKLCALLMLTTAQRVQTLHVLKLSCICFESTGCTIKIVDKLKHTRQGYHQGDLKIGKYPESEKLCVIQCLLVYVEKTKSLRSNVVQLLLSIVKPYGPASKDTIARWLKTVLLDAGIDGFKAHSFRGVASSAMAKAGTSMQVIMKTAGWTNAATFQRFYNKPVMKKDRTVDEKANLILKYFESKK